MFDRAKFELWKQRVNIEVLLLCGLGADDLPDCCYADWFEDGVSAKAAAKRALKNAF